MDSSSGVRDNTAYVKLLMRTTGRALVRGDYHEAPRKEGSAGGASGMAAIAQNVLQASTHFKPWFLDSDAAHLDLLCIFCRPPERRARAAGSAP